jgi:hypothetical protein
MTTHYTNKITGEQIDSQKSPNCDEALELLARLTKAEGSLVLQISPELGLDFQARPDGSLFMEIYAAEISGAVVSSEIAPQVMRRAFEKRVGNPKEIYGDLISDWLY